MLPVIVLLGLLSLSPATTIMTVTQAGRAPFEDIVEMKLGQSPTVCVQRYQNGISVRCGGTSVRAPVTFFVNGRRGRTVRDPPFQIAGAGEYGTRREIYRWRSFDNVEPRVDGTRKVDVECKYTNRYGRLENFTRSLIIAAPLCDAHLYNAPKKDTVPWEDVVVASPVVMAEVGREIVRNGRGSIVGT